MKWKHSAYPLNNATRAVYRFMETPYVGQIEIINKIGIPERIPHRNDVPMKEFFQRHKPDSEMLGYYSWLWKASRWGAPETSW